MSMPDDTTVTEGTRVASPAQVTGSPKPIHISGGHPVPATAEFGQYVFQNHDNSNEGFNTLYNVSHSLSYGRLKALYHVYCFLSVT